MIGSFLIFANYIHMLCCLHGFDRNVTTTLPEPLSLHVFSAPVPSACWERTKATDGQAPKWWLVKYMCGIPGNNDFKKFLNKKLHYLGFEPTTSLHAYYTIRRTTIELFCLWFAMKCCLSFLHFCLQMQCKSVIRYWRFLTKGNNQGRSLSKNEKSVAKNDAHKSVAHRQKKKKKTGKIWNRTLINLVISSLLLCLPP